MRTPTDETISGAILRRLARRLAGVLAAAIAINLASAPACHALAFPDLTIASSHSGNFTQGQTFRPYTLTVSNNALGGTTAAVTVTDSLPAGLTAVSMAGSGWSCNLATLKCTRADTLNGFSSYPVITLVVNVSMNAPALVTNVATVSGGGEINAGNDTSNDPTTINPTGPSCGTFELPSPLSSAMNPIARPESIGVGDFNGDGIADLAVPDNMSSVWIFLGYGDGSFARGAPFTTLGSAYAMVVGDFNADGKLDLAFLGLDNNGQTWVSMMPGFGDGTFGAPVGSFHYSGGPSTDPVTFTAGDFDKDGKLDLVLVHWAGEVQILQGNGAGSFALSHTYGTGFSTSVVTGDFNGDGNLDLAIAQEYATAVSIFLGAGDGTFNVPVSYSTIGDGPSFVATADLNGDGRLDLVTADGFAHDVSVFIGNGDGTFKPAVGYYTITPDSVAIGDFNGDGKADLLVMTAFDGTQAEFRPGNGDGTFGAPVDVTIGADIVKSDTVVVADFDGNGKPDLVIAANDSFAVWVDINACPDLTLTKTHSSNFTQGQTGASYSIVARNIGAGMTASPVTVVDSLPSGLTATALAGSGWSCSLGTLTCTRSDSLAQGLSYPPITLTASVNSNATNLTNTATVSGGSEMNVGNDTAQDATTIITGSLVAPTRFVAAADSVSQVTMRWDAVSSATKYYIYRSDHHGTAAVIASPTATTYTDPGLTEDTTYVYAVAAVSAANAIGPVSNNDIATTTHFTDDPIIAGSTVIQAAHLMQLRSAVAAALVAAGQPIPSFTDSSPAAAFIKAAHITELRSALDTARSILGVPSLTYTDPSLVSGATVKATHIQELREGVK